MRRYLPSQVAGFHDLQPPQAGKKGKISTKNWETQKHEDGQKVGNVHLRPPQVVGKKRKKLRGGGTIPWALHFLVIREIDCGD